jgi:hypothetical protein
LHAENYIEKMTSLSPQINEDTSKELIDAARNQIETWKDQLTEITSLIESDQKSFDCVKDLLKERLMTNACSVNQGYVMSDFQLDSERASHLFSEVSQPEYVIILNKQMSINKECLEIEERNDENLNRVKKKSDEKTLMQRTLAAY